MPYWVLSVAAVACFTAMFTLLVILVHQLRPRTFKFKAAITKWVSVEVELQSPAPTNRNLPPASLNGSGERQQLHRPQVTATVLHNPPTCQDDPH